MKELKDLDPEALKNYELVVEELDRLEPKIIDILRTPMHLADRTRLVELYEIYKTSMPNTEEYVELRANVKRVLKDAQAGHIVRSSYSENKIEEMEKTAEAFKDTDTSLELRYRILSMEASDENKHAIYRRYEEFTQMRRNDDEFGKMKNWLSWATQIPHDRIKTFGDIDVGSIVTRVAETMDRELYGMKEAKEQVLLFLNTKLSNPSMKRCSLGLVGPPGVGKTQLARLLATALDYPFEQISLGGVRNSDFLKGHDYTYVGAQPGEVVRCLRRMKHKNGILFLDEYEKVSESKDLSAALLHLTDPGQNNEYRDNFLSELTIDLSHIWFIYSMNSLPEDEAVRDRVFAIELPGYSSLDKSRIVCSYLLPKALRNVGLEKGDVILDDKVSAHFVQRVSPTGDRGVRTIEKNLVDMVNKINFLFMHQSGEYANKISFKPGYLLEKPLQVTRELVDVFIPFLPKNESMVRMYM